ncbi:hypothetical protein BFW01_g9949 [Lasiodiplodia theobromae]|uniref:Uncharacterized protein n=1 Tax=Lasiodiplodia theobromae TaxID=45133 RepID=A0A5N5D6D8_9PEZI|nr:E3 ubiquitin-protein ligase [Lasiodiplodia theobromae]KAB2572972.1 hypothetical protein DBV05_g8342 [Lasiodiplodia theobromae]KAF4545312.1 E3 ubiquitin-protein ligase [Lasiodiplodia theobromae]KAF9639052.1 hypothetical protein BFW01_g9949 [Lasiodiplodia theobromae]
MEPLKVRLKGHPSTSSSATPDPTTNSSGSPQALGPGPSAPTEAPSTSKSYTPPVLPPNLALEPNMYEDAYYVPKEYRSMSYEDMSNMGLG